MTTPSSAASAVVVVMDGTVSTGIHDTAGRGGTRDRQTARAPDGSEQLERASQERHPGPFLRHARARSGPKSLVGYANRGWLLSRERARHPPVGRRAGGDTRDMQHGPRVAVI